MRVVLVYINAARNVGFGVGYVASTILADGHELLFIDSTYHSLREIIRLASHFNPEIILLSTMSLTRDYALKVAAALKETLEKEILIGGLEATIAKEKLLKHKFVDYICVGEGESFISEFLKKYGSSEMYHVKNLGYKKNREVVINTVREPENLANLPKFRWDIWHDRSIMGEDGVIRINVARGCPYACSYCCNSVLTNLYHSRLVRYKPLDHVFQEINFLKKRYSPKRFSIQDDNFVLNRKAVEAFCERYISEEVGVPFSCMARPEALNEELVRVLRKAGCDLIGMGVECGHEEYRKKYLNRHMTNKQIKRAFALCRKHRIRTVAFNMIGLPFEDKKTLGATVGLLREIRPTFSQFSIFYPFEGTRLYDVCMENNLIDNARVLSKPFYYEDSILKKKRGLYKKRMTLDFCFNKRKIYYYLFGLVPSPMFRQTYYSYRVLARRLSRTSLFQLRPVKRLKGMLGIGVPQL